MDIEKRDIFIRKWHQYFGNTELPVTFQYLSEIKDIPVMETPSVHHCLISQIYKVRKGESLCFDEKSISCLGAKRYLMFSGSMPQGFECYISHYPDGKGERYKKHPEQVLKFWEDMPVLFKEGDYILFKRWDKLEEFDNPKAVIFFVTPDVLSGLFTLACFDSTSEDAVIAPFGAGCTNIVYYPYREEIKGSNRAVIGLFDPSARKYAKSDLLTFAVPITKFMTMIDQMDESFLITDTWSKIQKRILHIEY